jgi:hypothetical protein
MALMSDRSGAFLSSESMGAVSDDASTDIGFDASNSDPGSAKLDREDNDRTADGEKIICRLPIAAAADEEDIVTVVLADEHFAVDEATARTARRATEERIMISLLRCYLGRFCWWIVWMFVCCCCRCFDDEKIMIQATVVLSMFDAEMIDFLVQLTSRSELYETTVYNYL